MNTLNSKRSSEFSVILLLFLAAFLVRAVGVNYGYDYPDERVNYSAKVLSGQLIPDQHFYPPLLYYITAFFFTILYAIGRIIPVWHSVDGFREQYFTDPTVFVVTARLVVCMISAAVAPLFYFVGREIGLNKRYALIPGIFAIFIPVMVIHSHYSKVDVPLSVSTILVFLIALKRIKVAKSTRLDILLGIAFALSVSFKHSSIFTTVPFAVLFYGIFLYEYKNLTGLLKSLVLVTISAVISWLIFNIGIVLDFKNFLDYQKVQAIMSNRSGDGILPSFGRWWSVVSDLSFGVNAGVVFLFLLFPVAIGYFHDLGKSKLVTYAFWISIVISTFVIISITGERQIESLWLPHVVAMQLFASTLLASSTQVLSKTWRLVPLSIAAVILMVSVWGTAAVMKQALARPIADELQEFIETADYHEKETKILTNFPIPLPQSLKGKHADLDRDERLADKYGISLIPKSDEFFQPRQGSINYMVMPLVYAGLEYTDDESLGEAMKPGLWPLQEEEWFLDYWLDQGVEVIIYSNFYDELRTRESVEIKAFLQEIETRCRVDRHMEAVKPLFVEYSTTVFNCADVQSSSD